MGSWTVTEKGSSMKSAEYTYAREEEELYEQYPDSFVRL